MDPPLLKAMSIRLSSPTWVPIHRLFRPCFSLMTLAASAEFSQVSSLSGWIPAFSKVPVIVHDLGGAVSRHGTALRHCPGTGCKTGMKSSQEGCILLRIFVHGNQQVFCMRLRDLSESSRAMSAAFSRQSRPAAWCRSRHNPPAGFSPRIRPDWLKAWMMSPSRRRLSCRRNTRM